MTTGVKTYSSAGESTQKFDNSPPEPKWYDATLRSASVAIQTTKDKRPYIGGVQFELEGTSKVEGGRNKRVYHTFWLDMQAAKADGFPSIRKTDGLVPCARAFGEELTVGFQDVSFLDEEGNEKSAPMLDARETKAWLQARDGKKLRLRTGIRVNGDEKYGTVKQFEERSSTEVAPTHAQEEIISIPT
jgi:hypothetical protein